MSYWVAIRYNLIVLDSPPSSGPMQRAALAVAAFALVPTKNHPTAAPRSQFAGARRRRA